MRKPLKFNLVFIKKNQPAYHPHARSRAGWADDGGVGAADGPHAAASMGGDSEGEEGEIMHKILILIVASAIIVGCATTPIAPTVAKPAPNERIFAFQQKTPSTTSTLIVTRDEGFRESGCYCSLVINDTLAARLDVGETSRFFLDPGEIRLRVLRDSQGKGLCGGSQMYWTQRETNLRPGEIKYFRLLIDAKRSADIQPSEP